MNGYLVVFCGDMDDVPLRLFGTSEEAATFARKVYDEFLQDEYKAPILAEVLTLHGLDTSTFFNISIYPFLNGKPQEKYDSLPPQLPRLRSL